MPRPFEKCGSAGGLAAFKRGSRGGGRPGVREPMALHDSKRSRREPFYEVNAPSPMVMSPVAMQHTPTRGLSFGKGMPAGAVTPQRGGCSAAHAIGVQWGTASSIGPRQHMEDFGAVSAGDGDVIFGVFDGHGGTYCAEYCQQQLHHVIRAQGTFPTDVPSAIIRAYSKTDEILLDALARKDLSGGTCALVAVVTQTHVYVGNAGDCRAVYSSDEGVFELSQDHAATNQAEAERIVRGMRSCARPRRALQSRPTPAPEQCPDITSPLHALTENAYVIPSTPHAAGGIVEFGMVLLPEDGGELPITRALGDLRMKAVDPRDRLKPEMQVHKLASCAQCHGCRALLASPPVAAGRKAAARYHADLTAVWRLMACVARAQVVSSMPEVCVVRRSLVSAAFLIMASDGVWSCCKSDEAYALVESKLAIDENPQWAADQLLAHVVNEQQTCDNVFVIVVLLKPTETLEQPTSSRAPPLSCTPSMPPPPRVVREQTANLTPPTNSPLGAACALVDADAELCGMDGAVRSALAGTGAVGIATFSQQSVRVGDS